MRKLKTVRITTMIGAVILVVISAFLIGYGLINLGDVNDEARVTYMVTLISFIVSVVALLIALKTFFSIDSVNSITSMDGNVLENEHYSVSYPAAIHALSEAKDQEAFTNIVLSRMDFDRKPTHSCIEYADWLQKIIDNLVWLAYVDLNSDTYKKGWDKLNKGINRELTKYNSLSNCIQYVLQEHIKMIETVMTYIKWSNEQEEEDLSKVSILEDVRGGIIENPVSRTVYYDYLGLNYHKKARSLIMKQLNNKLKEGTRDFYKALNNLDFDEAKESTKAINAMLIRSLSAFDIASKSSVNDLLWDGYIKYNKVRVEILLSIIEKKSKDELKDIITELKEVVRIREDIKLQYAEKNSYLEKKLQEEIDLATNLLNAFVEFTK